MCVFCRIVKGELPAAIIYRGKHTLGILDINPVNRGHSLIISREHYSNIVEVPDEVLCEAIKAAKLIAVRLKRNLQAEGINLFQTNGRAAGQEIEHFHLHVIPRFSGDGTKFRFNIRKYASEDEKNAIRELLEINSMEE